MAPTPGATDGAHRTVRRDHPTALVTDTRPRLRGWIHLYAAVVSVATGVAVVIGAALLSGAGAALACAIYAATVCGVFGVSATYHRVPWSTDTSRTWMKRADHSMIFLFIAGSYTPFCVLALPSPTRWIVLSVVWVGAVAGVALTTSWPEAPRWVGVPLYIVLGWTIVAVAPTLVDHAGVTVVVLLAVGGVLYSGGAVLYATRWPDPWPTTFGHHEFFHAGTVAAALTHYVAVWLVVAGAG